MSKKRTNGEGNIRKRKDGRWEGRYTAGYNPETGKRIIKNVLARPRRSAKRSWPPPWRPVGASMSAAQMSIPWPRGCGAGTTSMPSQMSVPPRQIATA